jgi:LDH2 family malate/lactate/ureidoglycolate dehydrogenase
MNDKSHYHFSQTKIIPYEDIKNWVTKIFLAVNLSENDAELVADSLVDADARGVYSHGVQRVKIYMTRILKGCINVSGKPHVVIDNDATTIVDGNNAMGQVVGVYSMQLAIDKAKKYGISFVVAKGSNHYGRCAYYSRMALEYDMIGFSSTIGGGNLMAPWGGSSPKVGNNPFSIAIPAKERYPVVLDMALSVVAKGKIEVALKTGASIPSEWALDKNGNPTTKPSEALKGTLRPIGDYKGSGLAIVVGLMSSVICDAAVGPTLKDVYKDFDGGLNKGQLFMAIDIGHMTDIDGFKERMDRQIDFIKSSPLAPGAEAVYLPGEIEYRNFYKQCKEGIKYPIEIIHELAEISENVGVKPLPLVRE